VIAAHSDPTNCQYHAEVVEIPPGQPTGRLRQEQTEVLTPFNVLCWFWVDATRNQIDVVTTYIIGRCAGVDEAQL
jgi:hypothetical protein